MVKHPLFSALVEITETTSHHPCLFLSSFPALQRRRWLNKVGRIDSLPKAGQAACSFRCLES